MHVYGVPSKYDSVWKLGSTSTHARVTIERADGMTVIAKVRRKENIGHYENARICTVQ